MRSWLPLLFFCFLVGVLCAPREGRAQQPQGFYHTVQPRETLSILSSRFGVPVAELARVNRLAPTATLAAGSRVWIPRPPQAASRPQASAPAAAARPSTTGPGFSSSRRPSTPAPQPRASTPAPAPTQATTPSRGSDTYVVQRGDSLWGVANRHSMTVAQLASLNGLSNTATLHVGQRLRVAPGEDVPGGGVAASTPSSRTAAASNTPRYFAPSSTSRFIWPVEGRVVRRFANSAEQKYTGIDIQAPKGTEVRASRGGRVVYVGDTIPGYGQMVIISHDGDFATCYAHLDRILVRSGQEVSQGQVIARSGDTGRGSSPFLHFEIRRNGEAVNPEPLLP